MPTPFIDSDHNNMPYLNLKPILEENIFEVLAKPIEAYYELEGVHVPYPSSIEISSQHKFTDDKDEITTLLGIAGNEAATLNLERFGTHGYLNLEKDIRMETITENDLVENSMYGSVNEDKISLEDQSLIVMGADFKSTFPYLRPDNLSLLYQRSPKRMLKTNIVLKCRNLQQLETAKNILQFLNTKQLARAGPAGLVGAIKTIRLKAPPLWAIWASDGPRPIHNRSYFPDFHHCYLVAMAIKTSGGNSDMVNYVFQHGTDDLVGNPTSPLSITIQLAFMEAETTMARSNTSVSPTTANYSSFSKSPPV